MDNKKLRLVTRSSALAMKQTYEVFISPLNDEGY